MSNASLVAFASKLQKKEKTLVNMLGDKNLALKFQSSVINSIQKTPALLSCDSESVMSAFMTSASLGLFPSDYSGDCYVLPYKGKAQFQLGYKGVKTLAYRSGVLRCGTEVVYQNDTFERKLGTEQSLIHEPASSNRGEPIGAYAWAEITKGNIIFKYLSKNEIMEIKDISPASTSKYSPWNTNDPQKWMWQKTTFKQLAKMLPTSEKMEQAIYLDNESETGGHFNNIGGFNEFVEVYDDSNKIEVINDKKQELRNKKELPKELTDEEINQINQIFSE